jgi:hypothetical protein
LAAGIIVSAGIASQLVTRVGFKNVLAVGMTFIGIGMLIFTRISPTGSYASDVLVPGVITTTGIGLAFVPATITAVAGVARSDSGLAGGLVNTARQMGGSLGLAVLATVATERTNALAGSGGIDAAALTGGFHRAFLVGAFIALAGAAIAAVLLVRVPHPRAEPQTTTAEPAIGAAASSER